MIELFKNWRFFHYDRYKGPFKNDVTAKTTFSYLPPSHVAVKTIEFAILNNRCHCFLGILLTSLPPSPGDVIFGRPLSPLSLVCKTHSPVISLYLGVTILRIKNRIHKNYTFFIYIIFLSLFFFVESVSSAILFLLKSFRPSSFSIFSEWFLCRPINFGPP